MLERAEDKRNQVKVVDIERLVPSEHLLRKIGLRSSVRDGGAPI